MNTIHIGHAGPFKKVQGYTMFYIYFSTSITYLRGLSPNVPLFYSSHIKESAQLDSEYACRDTRNVERTFNGWRGM